MNGLSPGRAVSRYLWSKSQQFVKKLSDGCIFDQTAAKEGAPALRRKFSEGVTWQSEAEGDGGLMQYEETAGRADGKAVAKGPGSGEKSRSRIRGGLQPLFRAARDFEREIHEVVDVIFPGPLGAVVSKFGREEREKAVSAVELARAKWADSSIDGERR